MDLLNEGVDDSGILKAVFLAGGPGSGKSYVASQLFGIPDKINVSYTGMKTVNSDQEFEHLMRKYGFDTFGTGNFDIDKWPEYVRMIVTGEDSKGNKLDPSEISVRGKAKGITNRRMKQYIEGRLGMIIDGTGHDYGKIVKEKKKLEQLGYDCYMVFVNTSLEVAHERNEKRQRSLSKDLLEKSWKDVQDNMGKFQNLFGQSEFVLVDNSQILDEKEAQKKFGGLVKKHISKFVKRSVKNKLGKVWIKTQRMLKKR
jgi:predicted kinase